MNSVTNQMDKKFDDYMSKILTAIDKPKSEPNVTLTQTQQFQNPYFTTQQGYSNQITPQHMQSPPHIQTSPLQFANPRSSYTPQTQHDIIGSHQELTNGLN